MESLSARPLKRAIHAAADATPIDKRVSMRILHQRSLGSIGSESLFSAAV